MNRRPAARRDGLKTPFTQRSPFGRLAVEVPSHPDYVALPATFSGSRGDVPRARAQRSSTVRSARLALGRSHDLSGLLDQAAVVMVEVLTQFEFLSGQESLTGQRHRNGQSAVGTWPATTVWHSFRISPMSFGGFAGFAGTDDRQALLAAGAVSDQLRRTSPTFHDYEGGCLRLSAHYRPAMFTCQQATLARGPLESAVESVKRSFTQWNGQSCAPGALGTDRPLAVSVTSTLPRVALE
jgi:hypothetical protein